MIETYLADACALIAFYGTTDTSPVTPKSPRLTPAGEAALQSNGVHVATITVWEIAQKIAAGKLSMVQSNDSLASLLARDGYLMAPYSWENAEKAANLPAHHKDPMDRMLIAIALHNGMTVITCDEIFSKYGVKTVW